jgi:hypothetical protein
MDFPNNTAHFAAKLRKFMMRERLRIADGKRFIVHADEKLTAFLELQSVICACGELA